MRIPTAILQSCGGGSAVPYEIAMATIASAMLMASVALWALHFRTQIKTALDTVGQEVARAAGTINQALMRAVNLR
jgi:hypothetical protein